VLVGPSLRQDTTLRMIAGLEDITDGEIGGTVVNDVPPKDYDIAWCSRTTRCTRT
jgi:multiple sugar transport system ATP-binding protein